MFTPNNCEITITIGDRTVTYKTPHSDEPLENIIEGIYGLLITHTFSPSSILYQFKEFAEETLPFVDSEYKQLQEELENDE